MYSNSRKGKMLDGIDLRLVYIRMRVEKILNVSRRGENLISFLIVQLMFNVFYFVIYTSICTVEHFRDIFNMDENWSSMLQGSCEENLVLAKTFHRNHVLS